VLQEMLAYFAEVWKIRQKEPPKFDLISMLAHGEATRDLPSRPQEFMGKPLTVDRRRQRHDAQLDQRRAVVPEPVSPRSTRSYAPIPV